MMNNVEDFYPLTPTQQGMLFHSLYAPHSGVYVEQISCTFRGVLDYGLLEEAWHSVVQSYPVLRTSFIWKEVKEPIQVVHKDCRPPLTTYNWRHLNKEEQEAEFQKFLREDRAQGFDLARAPLMRLQLIELSDTEVRFVWSHHHILLDGWSVALVLKGVMEHIHSARSTGALKADRSYRDFIVWLKKQDQRAAEAYWRTTLQGLSYPTLLGDQEDRQRTLTEHNFKEEKIELSSTTTLKLRTFAQQNRITLNTLIQGAWSIVLHRHSGAEDIMFGTTVSGRPENLQGVEQIVGLFMNTLPLRVLVDGEQLLPVWLRNLQESQLHQRNYEFSSLIDIKKWSEMHKDVPLFESIIVFENYPMSSLQSWNDGLEMVEARSDGWTNYPLTLLVIPEEQLLIRAKYDSEYFDPDYLQQLLHHFKHLLEQIAEEPERRIAQYRLVQDLSLKSAHVSTGLPNTVIHQEEENLTLLAPFHKMVALFPNKPAVVKGEEQLTYQELDDQSDRIAQLLYETKHQSKNVALMFSHSINMIVAILGTLKAGKTYVPIDPTFPLKRNAYILEDSNCHILLTDEFNLSQAKMLGSMDMDIINLDTDQVQSTNTFEGEQGSAESLAYILYTSGSTGKPKGVMQTQRNVRQHIRAYTEQLDICNDDRISLLASYSFDASVMDIYGALLNGATLILVDMKKDGLTGLTKTINEQEVTIYHSTPTVYRYWLQSVESTSRFPSVRYIVLGGEEVVRSDVELYKQYFNQNCLFVNGYGPSESTLALQYFINSTTELRKNKVPIGYPVKNTEIILLDDKGHVTDVQGEIAIRSSAVALGYWQQQELTEKAFDKDPLDERQRIYRTGDIGRITPEGSIIFVGRKDYQVKIRGYRIETSEIEAVLLSMPKVREAVIVAQSTDVGEKYLVAYVVPTEALGAELIMKELEENLPSFMVPQGIVTLEGLPLTPSGKVDRRALPAYKPIELHNREKKESVPPKTELERSIVEVWKEVLQLEQVGVNENFFELGGHSLSLIQVHTKLQDKLNQELPLVSMFRFPTVRSLVESLRDQEKQQVDLNTVMNRVQRKKQQQLRKREVKGGYRG